MDVSVTTEVTLRRRRGLRLWWAKLKTRLLSRFTGGR